MNINPSNRVPTCSLAHKNTAVLFVSSPAWGRVVIFMSQNHDCAISDMRASTVIDVLQGSKRVDYCTGQKGGRGGGERAEGEGTSGAK